MVRFIRVVVIGFLFVAIPGIPMAYCSWRQVEWRNFHVVHPGQLYRSGQLSAPTLDRVLHDHKISTVICLRNYAREGDAVPEDWEERYCRGLGIRYVRCNPRSWTADERGSVPAQQNVDEILAELDRSRDRRGGPVLIHCFAGLHRTGAFIAIARMEYDGWTNAEAIAEMKAIGFKDHVPDLMQYLESYRPRHRRSPAVASLRSGQ